jgi:hypothetical protein
MTIGFGPARLTLNGAAIKGTSAARFSKRQARRTVGNGGDLHATLVTAMTEAPRLDFVTTDIGVVLAALSNAQTPMAVLSGAGAVALWPKGNEAGPGWASGSTGKQVAMATGSAYVNRLSWSPGAGAVVEVSAFGTSSNGTTSPAVESAVAAPAQLGSGTEFVLTALTVGGVAVPQIASLSIEVGHKAENNLASAYNLGLPQPLRVVSAGASGIIEITCTIETHDMTANLNGGAVVVATFQDKALGGPGFGTGQVVVTLNGELLDDDDYSDGNPGSRTLQILAAYDGSNLPFTAAVT